MKYKIKGFLGVMVVFIHVETRTDHYLAYRFFDVVKCLGLPMDDVFFQCEESSDE